MKIKIMVLCSMLALFIASCNNEGQENQWPPSQKIDSVVVKTTVAKYTSYGDHVIYFHSYKDSFAKDLQEWIAKNPGRVITAIGYDPQRMAHPTAEGYFIIHYPDSTFNPFKTR